MKWVKKKSEDESLCGRVGKYDSMPQVGGEFHEDNQEREE